MATHPGRPGPPAGEAGRAPHGPEEHSPACRDCGSRPQNQERTKVWSSRCPAVVPVTGAGTLRGWRHRAQGRKVLLHNLRLQRQFKNTYEINCPCLGWPHVSEADRERCGSLQVTERHHGRAAGLPATGEWCQDGTRHAGHALPPGGQSATLRNSQISLRRKQELWRLRSL